MSFCKIVFFDKDSDHGQNHSMYGMILQEWQPRPTPFHTKACCSRHSIHGLNHSTCRHVFTGTAHLAFTFPCNCIRLQARHPWPKLFRKWHIFSRLSNQGLNPSTKCFFLATTARTVPLKSTCFQAWHPWHTSFCKMVNFSGMVFMAWTIPHKGNFFFTGWATLACTIPRKCVYFSRHSIHSLGQVRVHRCACLKWAS